MSVAHSEAPDDYSVLLAGQLGYLTPVQEKALGTFKENLTKAQLYSAEAPSHDDSTLL